MADVFSQHHIKARDADIARYCFIPGDHVRGRKMAGKLDNMRLVADTRGYFVYTGLYKGVPMTVCSTGMGGPQVSYCHGGIRQHGCRHVHSHWLCRWRSRANRCRRHCYCHRIIQGWRYGR